MAFDRDKFKSLVHYVCWKAGDPSKLGAIKLNKILWLADFLAYYERDRAITDARYIRRQFGPVPSAIQPVIRELQEEGILRVAEVASHDHVWRAAADGEEIPYFTIFAIPGKITVAERQWAAQQIEEMRS